MKKLNFDKLDDSKLKENFDNACNDENFNRLINKLNMPSSELMKHTSSLEETVMELKNCSNCKGVEYCKNKLKGFVYYPENYNGKLIFDYIACKGMKKIIRDKEMSCDFFEMPESIKNAAIKNIRVDDAKRIPIIKWIKRFYESYFENPNQKGLYLHGSFGSGKTYIITALLNELAKKNVYIVIAYYPELLVKLKESFDSDFSTKLNRIKRAEILFLDDIGAEAVTSWSRDEILGTILQYRMDANLPTFFTSNLNIEELEMHLSMTKTGVDKVKARRIIERIKQLTCDIELVSKNFRN